MVSAIVCGSLLLTDVVRSQFSQFSLMISSKKWISLNLKQAIATNDYNSCYKFINCIVGFSIWLYMVCSFGDRVTNRFVEINDLMYSSVWYLYPIKLRKYPYMVILIANKPVYLKAYPSFYCTLETFKKVFNDPMYWPFIDKFFIFPSLSSDYEYMLPNLHGLEGVQSLNIPFYRSTEFQGRFYYSLLFHYHSILTAFSAKSLNSSTILLYTIVLSMKYILWWKYNLFALNMNKTSSLLNKSVLFSFEPIILCLNLTFHWIRISALSFIRRKMTNWLKFRAYMYMYLSFKEPKFD